MKYTLILGCIIFEGQADNEKIFISDVDEVIKFNTSDEADEYGANHIDNEGGDSYMVLETCKSEDLKWSPSAEKQFKKLTGS
jgi:hypothetical protein